MRLFQDDASRKLLQSITFEAFGRYFVIDTLWTNHMRVRMATRLPTSDEEQSWRQCARDFYKSCAEITSFSDGVRAFSGLVAGVIALPHKVVLIDEPEAFLHPPLARFLGQKLVEIATPRGAHLFVSTHSADFLMGCVESGMPVTILRLEYDRGIGSASCISADDVRQMMYDPLLRSTGVLSSLFHRAVVVCEGDTDRSFYSEINTRLLRAGRVGAKDTAFIHAQNKQTIPRIVKPLRQIGLPAAAIVDIDVIKDGGQEWTRLVEAAGVPQSLHQMLSQLRSQVKSAFIATGKCMKRDGGVSLLSSSDQAAFSKLADTLAEYGVFLVSGGEVEVWLKGLDATGHGPEWLIKVFEKMGADPTSSDYLSPGAGDVWGFMEDVAKWFQNPERKGLRLY